MTPATLSGGQGIFWILDENGKNFEGKICSVKKKVYLCSRFQTTRIKIMMYNSYKYNANPTLRLGRKVAPAMGTGKHPIPF